MRVLKGLIITLAIAGVVALVMAARATPRPLTTIASINPAMNFAYVRIRGLVVDFPSLSLADGYLTFHVQDQTGDIPVAAYRATVDSLLAQKRIPMPGSIVTLEGTLRVREEEPGLTLNTPEALAMEMPVAQNVAVGSLDAVGLGERVMISGQVRRIRDGGSLFRIVTIRDGDAEADVLLPLQLTEMFGSTPRITVGSWISVSGGLNAYRDRREVLVTSAQDVNPIPTRRFETRPISALNKMMVGKWIAVDAVVEKLRPIKQGMLIDLKDGSGKTITAVLYEQWFEVPFSTTLHAGSGVSVQGELVDFRGQLEVQPELSADLVENQ